MSNSVTILCTIYLAVVFFLLLLIQFHCFLLPGRIQSERQHALEKMGISVQASGIKVEKNKYYLVNLNADPSLNELLVYYLKVIHSC